MNPSDWPEIEQLFLEATSLPRQMRLTILEKCRTPEIRAEVESLLAAGDLTGTFLDSPPASLAADLLKSQPAQLEAGQFIEHYQVQSLVSIGGMGEVYRAHDTRADQPVAIKLLSRHLSEDRASTDRFRREALAASALSHPNIVSVIEFGESAPGHFIAMEWVDGQTWRSLFRTTPQRTISDAIVWGRQAAQALSAAHLAGIVHRDIKPDNLMLTKQGLVKILDFGLARLEGYTLPEIEALGASGTISGTLSGTLPYMAPELLLGEPATTASDVFALASVLYELFTNLHPFAGATPLDVFEAIECRIPEAPSSLNPELPGSLDKLLLSMLDRNPLNRPTAQQIEIHFENL